MNFNTAFAGEKKKLTLHIKERLQRVQRRSIFPNTTVMGTYDFWSQVVILQSLEEKDVMELRAAFSKGDKSKSLVKAKKIFPLICHEQTHWLDNTTTLWGLELINDIYSCYEIWAKENRTGIFNEQEYYHKKLLADTMNTIFFPEYYTTVTKVDNARPWHYSYSMGKLFSKEGKISSYPLFFTKFMNNAGEQIARQPFSLASVLETSAMAQEFAASVGLILSMAQGDEIHIEQRLLQDEILDTIYDPEFTVYSAAAHHVANSFKLTDTLEAYRICAILSRFVLNFPGEMFRNINGNMIYGEDNVFSKGFEIAFYNKDRGVLFYFIVALLSKRYEGKAVTSNNVQKLLIEQLSQLGTNYDELIAEVDIKIRYLAQKLADLKVQYLEDLAKSAVANHEKLGLFGRSIYPFDELKMPGVLLGDDTFFSPTGSKDDSISDRYLALDYFSDHIFSFSDACVSSL